MDVKKLTKKDFTHQLIIEKAAQLFNNKGYSSTSISDIMKATGLKKGGIYSHFKSKTEIEIAAFDYLLNRIFNSFDPSVLNNKTAVEKLNIIIDYRESLYDSFLKGGCPILNAGIESDEYNQELQNHVKKSIERWKQLIIEIIKAGKKNNEIRPDFDPEEFAITYITVIEGGNFLTKVYNNRDYRAKAIDRIKKFIKEEIGE